MSLALAITNSMASLSLANKDYVTNVRKVTDQVTQVIKTDLPVFPVKPPHLDDFIKALQSSKVTSYKWVNSVYVLLEVTPTFVIASSTNTLATLKLCSKYAESLSRNPQDPPTKQALQDSLGLLVSLSPLVQVQNCVNGIKSFNNDLPGLAASLASIVQNAENDSNIDKKKLADLKKAIDSLNSQISALKAQIGILAGATGLFLIIGAVVTAIPEVGWLIWFLVGPAAAITAAIMAYDVAQLLKAQQEVGVKIQDSDNLTQVLAALDKMTKDVKVLAGSVDDMTKAAEAVLTAWTSLYDATSKAAGDLVSALDETKGQKPDYQKIQLELKAAVDHWTQLHDAAAELKIDTTASTMKADVGQLKETAEKAVDAPKISYLEYIAA
jgi:hypothetical protein